MLDPLEDRDTGLPQSLKILPLGLGHLKTGDGAVQPLDNIAKGQSRDLLLPCEGALCHSFRQPRSLNGPHELEFLDLLRATDDEAMGVALPELNQGDLALLVQTMGGAKRGTIGGAITVLADRGQVAPAMIGEVVENPLLRDARSITHWDLPLNVSQL